ncbi:MAG: diguanylate cyclase, partial [Treponema sp.]|nr:diguanylate cyclase [Treponema sp.]
MWKRFYEWRYYSLGKEHYYECINSTFMTNLRSLCQTNTIVAIFAGCFSLASIIIERDITKAGICFAAALIALLLAVFTNYKMQTQDVNNRFVYTITSIFYANIMTFGIYLSVWSSPDKLAAIFLCFLIYALLMVINSPLFTLCLTACAMACFVASTVIVKTFDNWIWDIINSTIACVISLYFNWQISKFRLGLELSTTMLENERNTYFDQSIIDELTQLKNRRDFQQTFRRYLSTYRTSDNWLCIAILDIDFFKYYNDHYGHQKG